VLALAALAALTGCAFPGSSLTQVEFRGRLVDEGGAPLVGEQLRLTLPAGYGLAGLDRTFGEPSDYGHRDQIAVVRTDTDGRFAHVFEPTTYSMSFFLLPPLGAIPGDPPAPAIYIRWPEHAPTMLVVQNDDDEIECWIYDPVAHERRADSRETVVGAASLTEIHATDEDAKGLRGWRLDVTIRGDSNGAK